MRTMLQSIGAMTIAFTLVLGWQATTVSSVHAASSPSYTLYGNYGDQATQSTQVSASYTLDQAGQTWHQKPLASTSYQLMPVLNGDGAASSASSVSSSSVSSSTETSGGGSGHQPTNRRPRPTTTPSTTPTPITPHEAAPSSASSSAGNSSSSSSVFVTELNGTSSSSAGAVMNQPYSLQFFDGIDPLCAPTETIETHVIIIDLWTLLLIVLIVTLSILFVRELRKKYKPRKEPKHRSAYLTCLLLGILAGLALLFGNQLIAEAHAAQTTPMKTVYNGRLLDSTGHAVTSAQSIRFSYWKSADEISSDIDGAGAINTSATTYANWQEVHVVTPNASGYFSVNLGDIVPLPDMSAMPVSTLLSMYLQVEVKPAVALDTAYEILDTDSTDTAIDRSGVLSVPFAQNADYIDQREIGTGSGSIPLLQSGGLMPIRTVPSGTNQNAFTIDSDNNASGEIALQFGAALGKKLTYDLVANTFKFNAPVEINGNLTVNGLVNGVNLSSLQSSTGALKASSGGGLNLNIAFGSYRLNGNVTNYPGGTLALIGNATNYVFFGSGGIMKNSTGFPTDESFIPVAQVTTSAGSITLIADRRTLQSDDREHTVQQVYSAAFEKTSYQGDGTSNIGQLSVSHDNISLNNFYLWTSTKTALQDYDMLMRLPVSSSFARWRNDGGNYSLTLSYRSTSANATDNKLDIEVFDTNGVPVTLSGTSTGLVSTSWTTVNLNFSASSTWTPGQDMMIRLKVYAKDNFQMQVGSLKLKYVELTKEN